MNEQPVMCLLHAEFHPLDADCAETLVSWYFNNVELGHAEGRNQYQAAVEAKMLAEVLG